MKRNTTSFSFPVIAFFISAMMGLLSCSTAQPVAVSKEDLTAAITADKCVFNAQRSDPPIGRSSFLSSGYEVRCSGDTAVFVLPYSGTMQAPARFPGGKGPLDFTSTDLTIKKVEKSPGKWIVTLKLNDQIDVISGTFTFFDNGKASLDVLFTNRTPIYFFGTVEPLK